LEWISKHLKARTLFATHYHELTELPKSDPRLVNKHLSVSDKEGSLEFLYKLMDGPSNESYGIQVAKLAGLPSEIIHQAWNLLEKLETQSHPQALPFTHPKRPSQCLQPSLFEASPRVIEKLIESPLDKELKERLKSLNLNQTTPLQALQILEELQNKLSSQS
jgi:DNA mismatch repair protein MutS